MFLVAGFAFLLLMWFGIPWISSRSPFVAADNALHSGRRLHSDLVFGTTGRFLDLQPRGLELAAYQSRGAAGVCAGDAGNGRELAAGVHCPFPSPIA